MGPKHTFNSPHLPTLTFPYISPYLPHTPSHFPAPPFIPPPTSLLPPPTPQHIFLLSPHLPSPFTVWRSYHVTKFLWRSYCGEVTMRRSYWQPFMRYRRKTLKWNTTSYTVKCAVMQSTIGSVDKVPVPLIWMGSNI